MCATNSVKFGWISPKLLTARVGMEMLFFYVCSVEKKNIFCLKEDTDQFLKAGLGGNHRAGCAQCATS